MPRKPTPMQPIEHDAHGVLRFRRNRIVDDLLSFATVKSNPGGAPGYELPREQMDMNHISLAVQRGEYTVEEYKQLCQLVGYSVSGYNGLTLVQESGSPRKRR